MFVSETVSTCAERAPAGRARRVIGLGPDWTTELALGRAAAPAMPCVQPGNMLHFCHVLVA